jgi:hypothetical protein
MKTESFPTDARWNTSIRAGSVDTFLVVHAAVICYVTLVKVLTGTNSFVKEEAWPTINFRHLTLFPFRALRYHFTNEICIVHAFELSDECFEFDFPLPGKLFTNATCRAAHLVLRRWPRAKTLETRQNEIFIAHLTLPAQKTAKFHDRSTKAAWGNVK